MVGMLGYRKLFVVVFIGTIAATVQLTPEQADVLKTLAGVYLGSNALVHGAQILREKVSANKDLSGTGIRRVVAVTDPEQVDRPQAEDAFA